MQEKWKGDNDQFLIKPITLKSYYASRTFLITGRTANIEQFNFSWIKSFLKGLPVTSKAASGYIGQIVRYWIKGNIPRIEKSRPDTHNKGFT